ncbi:hypothetical protein CLUG_01690 [Clavispora lusitaniae ATCC 42720]|uniref:Fcf2 pre-rRNA processing C-terminal domain-containing protein n=1 Tax=Clavispora lusitaniae (strain ATCC 42720) TaxID=306902 RepID=C4Y0F8_CLAL4|nr:uncharacterized protein CLUG_01690 [Clavispora lusitaniae ATCC 42720]EEQ37567.1 hypothetical protein CLUG_01690 [Clavispora lusitaniae ATCC 42720]
MASKKGKVAASNDVSLDQLFQQLAQETKHLSKPEENSLSNIEKEIESLPKIESELETQMQEAIKSKSEDVVKLNDPITHIRKTVVDKDADSGSKWFNMKKPEMTAEIKRDLMVLKNRSVLDPKRHYKKEKWQIPKFFQTGTIVEGNTEFYSARMAKRNRGRTLAEEILNDDIASDYFKRKYSEIQKQKRSGGKAHYKKIKEKRRGF